MPSIDGDALTALYRLLAQSGPGPAPHPQTVDVLRHLAKGQPPPCDAFAHPLGFLYLPLLRMSDATLRLHIWLNDQESRRLGDDEISSMHDHTWNMTSYVICGELRNVIVSVAEDADAPTHRVFEIHGDGAVDDIRATDTDVRVVGECEDKVSLGRRTGWAVI